MAFEDIRTTRLEKLESIRKRGINPFPSVAHRTHQVRALISDFETLKTSPDISIAGRIISIREHGGSTFANLEDYSGVMQIYFKKDVLAERYDFFIAQADLGDFIEARGTLFSTKRGEKTLEVKEWKMLSKTLRPIPEKWYGLEDVEERFRRRYLDLLANKGVKKVFETRSKMITKIRTFLDREGFLEVETPILQTLPGGASARPFETRLNALAMDLYLRIAPELYLKRLIVGGFEKIYELGRNFRNEGMDRTHNPEFTMLELYVAYEDYRHLMNFTEQLLQHVVRELFGTLEIKSNGNTIHFNRAPWKRVEFEALVNSALGEDHKNISLADLKKKFKSLGVKADLPAQAGAKIMKHKAKMIDEVFKKIALPKIIDPTFVINHPAEISPLAKGIEGDSEKAERFQLVVGGLEIVNGFSELNDPIEQEKRFKAQEKLKKAGDQEAQSYDKDFLEALEYGMPPTAGLGIGIDRLAMLLTNSKTIRDVLLFPTMRPKKQKPFYS